LERLAFTPSNSQIRSVGADQIEPRLVEKLSKSKRARASVCLVGIAIGFNGNDTFHHRIDKVRASRLITPKLMIQPEIEKRTRSAAIPAEAKRR